MDTQTPAETAAGLRAQAQALRDQAKQLRAEDAAALVAGQQGADLLRAEADRVLAEARSESSRLRAEADSTDREAEPVERRAGFQQEAEDITSAIPTVETRIVDLYTEVEDTGETIASLRGRLAELGVDREDVGVHLAAAREAGDVDGVVAARARMTAIDEVVSTLENQKRAAEQRVVAVGAPDEDGELGQAARLLMDLRTRQRHVLNQLDPERAEAQVDALVQQLTECVDAQYGQLHEQQNPGARRANTVIRN